MTRGAKYGRVEKCVREKKKNEGALEDAVEILETVGAKGVGKFRTR